MKIRTIDAFKIAIAIIIMSAVLIILSHSIEASKKLWQKYHEKNQHETKIEKLYRYRTYCLSGNDDRITADFNCETFKTEIDL
jgi:hypothetical protein